MGILRVIFAWFLVSQAAFAAPTLGISTFSTNPEVGELVVVDVWIQGLGVVEESPKLSVFDLEISSNSSLFVPTSISFGDPVLGDQLDVLGLGSILASSIVGSTAALLEISLDAAEDLLSLQASDFVLAQVTFVASAPVSAAVSLAVLSVGDEWGDPLSYKKGAGFVVSVRDADGSGSGDGQVSEPATLALTAFGLLMAAMRSRGRARRFG